MGVNDVFNNNANEKPVRVSKVRPFLLSVILVHHLYTLNGVIASSDAFDISGMSEEAREQLSVHIDFGVRFLTIWNFIGQIAYVIMELALILLPSTKLPQELEKYSWLLFMSTIWPTTIYIMLIFWPLFYIDRELIFSHYCDEMLPPHANHSMHTLILVLLALEALTSTRDYLPPIAKTRRINIYYMLAYAFILIFTFFWNGVWLYPFLSYMTWTQQILLYSATYPVTQAFTISGHFVLGFRCRPLTKSVESLNLEKLR